MNHRLLAEMLLGIRESCRRIGASFEIYEDRLLSLGIDPKNLPLVIGVVVEIEQHKERQLSLLDDQH